MLDKLDTEINIAKYEGIDSVEAPMEIINHFNKNGLGGAEYFIYKGVKIYPLGKSEEIKRKESIPMEERLHGKDVGVVELK